MRPFSRMSPHRCRKGWGKSADGAHEKHLVLVGRKHLFAASRPTFHRLKLLPGRPGCKMLNGRFPG